MTTLKITTDSFCKLFGLKQKIENDRGISLTYHTGMFLGRTRFYKDGVCRVVLSNKGELNIDGRLAGIVKNKCATDEGKAIVATISSAKECCKAVAEEKEGAETEILFFKEGVRIAIAKGTHNGLRITFDNSDDIWVVLVLGWCSLDYVFMRVWDRITYFDPEHSQPSPQKKADAFVRGKE